MLANPFYLEGVIMKNSEEYTRSAVKGALSLTISALTVKFLGLIYKVPLSYMLSDEGMGYFNSAYTVYTFFFIICTAGVPKAIAILTSAAESEGNINKINTVYKTAFSSFAVIGLFFAALFFLFSKRFSLLIGNSGAYYTMLMIAPSIFFTSASAVIRGYFSGRLIFMPIAVSEIIAGISKLILGVLLAFVGYRLQLDFRIISALTILGTTIGAFFAYIYLSICKKRDNVNIKTRQNYKSAFSLSVAKSIFKVAVPITLTAAAGSIGSIIDLTVIMKRLIYEGYSELQAGIFYGNYTTLAIPMFNLVATLIAPLSAVLLPIVSKGDVKNDDALLSERTNFTLEIISFIAVPATFLFLFRSREILSIIFEDSGAVLGAPLLSLLAPGVLFMCVLTIFNTVLEGIGKTHIPLISLAIGMLVKIPVTFLLLGIGDLGLMGAPIGTTVSYAVSLLVSLICLYTVKDVRINFIKIMLPNAFAAGVAIIISNLVRRAFSFENSMIFLFDIVLFMLIYVIIISIIKYRRLKCLKLLAKYTKK